MINKDNLKSYLKNAKWKYNTGECPNIYENEYIIVQFESGVINYTHQKEPERYNWKLNEKNTNNQILKYARIKL